MRGVRGVRPVRGVCYSTGRMATNLRVEGMPEDLLLEVRLYAVSNGVTLRDLVLEGLQMRLAGGPQAEREEGSAPWPAKRSRTHPAPLSPRLQGVKRKPLAVLPDDELPGKTHTTEKHCSHGLRFHPGCTD